jgi:polar amino acid transport system substrate-binding protein
MDYSRRESLATLLYLRCLSSALLLLLLFLSIESQAAPLAINTFGAPPLSNADRTGFHDLLTIEAFSRLGIEITIPRLPAERALINADRGIDDGDLPRIAGLDAIYPNLIMVPESIMDYEFVTFSRHRRFSTTGWESLKPYNVAIITGWKILEKNVVGVRSLTKVKNQNQMFSLLKLDRADLVIYEKWQGLQTAKAMGIADIRILYPPLAKRKMFMYLHKKHADLVLKVAAALKQMKFDGTYQRIFDHALKPLQKSIEPQPGTSKTGNRKP